MKALPFIIVGVTWLADIAGAVYLGTHDHPGLGLFVVLLALPTGFDSNGDDE